jgi:riboflavin kinase/FMN adenylyltransferase
MTLVRSLAPEHYDRNSVVTVGTFDGVHRAHRRIIEQIVARARSRAGRSVVVTFDPHPKEVVRSAQGPVRLLTTLDERCERVAALGVDMIVVLPFTAEFSRLTAGEFYAEYLVRGVGVAEVVVGHDHMFGRGRQAGQAELEELGARHGFEVTVVPPVSSDGEVISSTRIRRALGAGAVERAAAMLGYPYRIAGTVVAGDGRGRTIGYPTANLDPEDLRKVVPARGVYAVEALAGDDRWGGMANIGVRPTVTDGTRETVEVHLFAAVRDLYGARLRMDFIARLRDERAFGGLDALRAQLGDDERRARAILAGGGRSATNGTA